MLNSKDRNLVVAIVIIVLIIVFCWYFLYLELTTNNAYYWINRWNQYLKPLRDSQNRIHSPGLGPSIQHAIDCNHATARRLEVLIRAQHDQILAEVNSLIQRGYDGIPMAEIDPVQQATFKNQTGWRPIWVKFIDRWAGTATELPTLRRIVKQMGSDILLLHVSIFRPGVELKPHRGPSMGVMRYHYGLQIPSGNTGMLIGGQPFKWAPGQGYIWDDTLIHSAWNRTSELRMVIFADLPRQLNAILDPVNRYIHRMIQQTSHIRKIQALLAQQGIKID